MIQVISVMVDIVRKAQKKCLKGFSYHGCGGGMWGHGGVFASLTQRLQRNTPKGMSSGDYT